MTTRHRVIGTLAAAVLLGAAGQASAVRFSVIGDWGSGSDNQARIAKRMCADRLTAPVSFIATVGDNFYNTGYAKSSNWSNPMRCLINTGLPWRAAWGNHDLGGGNGTATALKSPKRWYTMTPSGAVRLIFLDSNQWSNQSQLTWLKKVLQSEAGSTRPIIVLFHHPHRTAGTHGPATSQRQLWEPLFLKYGVKLVLQGHNHNYERIQYKSITYITTGGGGAGLYPCIRPTAGLKVCKSVHQFLTVTATPTKIGVRAVDTSGRLIDAIRLSPPRV